MDSTTRQLCYAILKQEYCTYARCLLSLSLSLFTNSTAFFLNSRYYSSSLFRLIIFLLLAIFIFFFTISISVIRIKKTAKKSICKRFATCCRFLNRCYLTTDSNLRLSFYWRTAGGGGGETNKRKNFDVTINGRPGSSPMASRCQLINK